MKKTKFSITTYFDPYGDMKSDRKELGTKNYESDLSITEIEMIIETYNNGQYYNAVSIGAPTDRGTVQNFDSSFYLTSKAAPSTYQSIPGY